MFSTGKNGSDEGTNARKIRHLLDIVVRNYSNRINKEGGSFGGKEGSLSSYERETDSNMLEQT